VVADARRERRADAVAVRSGSTARRTTATFSCLPNWARRRPPAGLSGTQIHPSCCAGVFVDQSAESVASVEVVWRAWTDEAWARPWYRCRQPERAMRPVGVVVVDVDA
jgi:hypothetical protein